MYRMLKIVAFSLLLLMSKSAFAQSVSDALRLIENSEYEQSFKILSFLSNQGDAVAQYNLGLMFKNGMGRDKDAVQAAYWFEQAAKKGLVQAYDQIQTSAIKPAIGIHVKPMITPEEWIKLQKPGYYTMQLASSTNKKLIEKYYLENNLQGKAGYYRNRREGKNWYALVYGAYPSIRDANEAVAGLPEGLRKWSPWVRKIKVIHRLMNN